MHSGKQGRKVNMLSMFTDGTAAVSCPTGHLPWYETVRKFFARGFHHCNHNSSFKLANFPLSNEGPNIVQQR